MKSKNRGFSLIELIVVIAIMAVLLGILTPQFIKYINKARKSVDIYNSDVLASSLRAAMADDSHSGWALQLLVQVSVNESKGKGAGVYRIMAYQNAGTLTTPFSLVKLENKLTHEEQTLCTDALRDIFSDVQPLKFTTKNDLDQWIICCDPKGSLYIFAGGHLNGNQYFITTNDGGKSYTANGNGGTCNMYMIWPEPCQSYMDLASPSASEYKKN